MYNRYIRNDQGSYTRIQEEDVPTAGTPPVSSQSRQSGSSSRTETPSGGNPPPESFTSGPSTPPPFDGLFRGLAGQSGGGSLRDLLDRFHLDRIDSGDLLLLGLLFLLYREGADEELLFALGLLLIL